ncbi:hypothetical protein BC940DRAFT_370184 [Gongronella butleri]|nr:hypothetical protein BC940DRAFT_370184 [Gongronella butleri]
MDTYPTYPYTTLHEFVLARVKRAPATHPMFVDAGNGETLNAYRFLKLVHGLNAGFRKIGVGKGQGVAVYSPNTVYNYVAYMGAWMTGAYVSPVNASYKGRELEHQLQLSKCKYLVAHPDTLDVALPYCKALGIQHVFSLIPDSQQRVPCLIDAVVDWSEAAMAAPIATLTQQESRTVMACLFFSSGTTGASKGVMTSHYHWISNIVEVAKAVKNVDMSNLTDDETCELLGKTVALGVLPVYHVAGFFRCLSTSLIELGTVVILLKYSVPAMCKAIEDFKITNCGTAPPILMHLINRPEVAKYDLSSVQVFTVGAAPISADAVRRAQEQFKRPVSQGFGASEYGPIITRTPLDANKPGSIGIPYPHTNIIIVDEHGKELGPNQKGELWVRGPQCMLGYIDNPEATRQAIDENGYYHTGDVGYYDDDGFFYIVDRMKELIKYKGLQVAPVELEALLVTHPDVETAGVIGIYDEEQATELPLAFIVPRDKNAPHEALARKIQAWVAERVSNHKRLRGGILFTDEIPTNVSGKILRREMKTMYERLKGTPRAKL